MRIRADLDSTGIVTTQARAAASRIGDPLSYGAELPPYSVDHRYRFEIEAPGGPLVFGVGDPPHGLGDNSGAFIVTVLEVQPLELVDPYPDLLGPGGLVDDVEQLETLGQHRNAVICDGHTRLLIRIQTDQTTTLTLEDPAGSPADPAWGTLLDLAGAQQGATIQVAPVF